MIIHTHEYEDVDTKSGLMRIHCMRPAISGKFPGILLFSEIYQVTDPIRRLAAMLAGHGYVVAIPEVYHEYEPIGTCLPYGQAGTDRGNLLKATKPLPAFDNDAHAALGWLGSHHACSGRLATAGVCLGGHLALRAAFNSDVSAAACFYPTDIHSGSLGQHRRDDSLARMSELQCPLSFFFGRSDPHIPFEGRERIRRRLEDVGASYEWHEVEAVHAFMRDEGPRYDPALFHLSVTWLVAFFHRNLNGRATAL